MTATYTFDIFSTLDGFANHNGDWGGYWGKQGPEFLAHRAAAYRDPLRMVLGAKTYSSNAPFLRGLRPRPVRRVDHPHVRLPGHGALQAG